MRGRSRLYRTSSVKGEKRTIPVPGEGAEDGRYFKCWYCGFIVDSRKNALDAGNPGNTHTPATLATGRVTGDLNSVQMRIGRPIVLRKLDSMGAAKTIYIERKVVISSGCPGCGTHAWKD